MSHYDHDDRVLGMVAIATPFSGSELAKLVPHDSFRELKTDSGIIGDLQSHKDVNRKIVSIFPEYDTHVLGEKSGFLDGAENIEIPVGGHNSLPSRKEVQDEVIKAIEKLEQKAG